MQMQIFLKIKIKKSRLYWHGLFGILLLASLGLSWTDIPGAWANLPQFTEPLPVGSRYFPATGKTLSGLFLKFWEENGGQVQFGLPVTDELEEIDPLNHKLSIVQWFERTKLEYHPAYRGTPYEVQPAVLGRVAIEAGLVRDLPVSFAEVNVFDLANTTPTAAFGFFPETKHTLRGVFKQHWETQGGLQLYGYPLSEQYEELNPLTGKMQLVQWFERAKFELYPEFVGTRYEVRLANLGWQMFHWKYRPAPAPVIPAVVSTSTTASASTPNFGYGLNAWLFGQDHARLFSLVQEAGFSWVRQQLGWNQLEPAPGEYHWTELDKIVAAAGQHNVQLLFSVVRSPEWIGTGGGFPTEPKQFAEFMTKLTARYANAKTVQGHKTVLAYEIWNEPNLGMETGGEVSAAKYVELLKAAYPAVKAAEQEALVLFAGLSPTGLTDERVAVDDLVFLRECYSYNAGEVRNYFDVLGAHTGSAGNAPDEFWPDNAPQALERGWTTHASFYFRRVEQLRSVMVKQSDAGKKIWLTEFGWTTANPAPGYEYGVLVSEQNQANYLVGAFSRAHWEYAEWLSGMFVWNLNFANVVDPTDEKAAWAILQADLTPRPAYLALKAMPK